MLGRFLEYSTSAEPLGPEHRFYLSLGFQDLPTGDFLAAPYAALSNGTITVGLHERPLDAPCLTFVRPELEAHVRALKHAGVVFESIRTTDDEFNHARFIDPSGQIVELVEARTHSPAPRESSSVSACGEFVEISIATSSVADAAGFWQPLGFEPSAGGADSGDFLRLTGHDISLGFHEQHFTSGLSFVCEDFSARRDFLSAKGLEPAPRAPFDLGGRRSTVLVSPAGTPIYLFESAEA